MKGVAPILAGETLAARLMDMKPGEFRELVEMGHLPRPKDIGGMLRWDVQELHRIATGEAVDGIGGIQWT